MTDCNKKFKDVNYILKHYQSKHKEEYNSLLKENKYSIMYQLFKNDKYYSGYIKRLIKMEYNM